MPQVLNKLSNDELGDGPLWETKDYQILPAKDAAGYDIINRNTGQVELFVEQEPQACLAIQWLQEAYDDIMDDPEAAFRLKKSQQAGRIAQAHPQFKMQ